MKTFLLAALLGASLLLHAQNRPNSQVGLRGGYGFSSISDEGDAGTKPSFNVSFYIQINTKSPVSFVINPGYERVGFAMRIQYRDVNGFVIGEGDAIQHLNYVKLPLNLKVHVGESRRVFMQAGFYASFLNSAKIVIEKEKVNTMNTDNFNGADFGVNLGIGLNLPVTQRFSLEAEIRGSRGLKDIVETGRSDFHPQNWNALVMLGFLFEVGNFAD